MTGLAAWEAMAARYTRLTSTGLPNRACCSRTHTARPPSATRRGRPYLPDCGQRRPESMTMGAGGDRRCQTSSRCPNTSPGTGITFWVAARCFITRRGSIHHNNGTIISRKCSMTPGTGPSRRMLFPLRGLAWPKGFPLCGLDNVRTGKRPPANPREFDWGPLDQADLAMGDGQMVTWAKTFMKQDHKKPFFLAAGIFRPASTVVRSQELLRSLSTGERRAAQGSGARS